MKVLLGVFGATMALIALGHGAFAADAGPQPGVAGELARTVTAQLSDPLGCPAAAVALPLLERSVAEADAGTVSDAALTEGGGRLLARTVRCRLWIRAQALTFDDREVTEASLSHRIAEALSFEESRAQFVVVAGGVDPAQAAGLLGALYQASFAAAPSPALLRHAPALARGFALEGRGDAALPATYRAKLTQAIVGSALKLSQRRARRTENACSGGLEKLPAQLEALRKDYQYPDSIVKVLAECPHNKSRRGVS